MLLGRLLGVDANVGGVGTPMLLLIVVTSRLASSNLLPATVQGGILFWSSISIPVVAAMAASLDVRGGLQRPRRDRPAKEPKISPIEWADSSGWRSGWA
jgi:malonate transporter MadL subunit